jgi:hypothetical protein
VSGVLSLAKPHRIKASHRRRWKGTTGHSVYIMNNPLSGTDPTGYQSSICSIGKNSNARGCETGSANTTLPPISGGKPAAKPGSTGNKGNGAPGQTAKPATKEKATEKPAGSVDVKDQTVTQNRVAKTNGERTATNGIVLHRTGGKTASGAIDQWKKDGLGTHFIVDENGDIIQTADVDSKTSHVGRIRSRCNETSSCSKDEAAAIKKIGWNPAKLNTRESAKAYPDRYPMNSDSIGIEVVGGYDAKTDSYADATKDQLSAVSALVGALQTKYSLQNDDVYTHSEVSYKAGSEGSNLGYDDE